MLAAFTFCLAGVGLALLSVSAKPPSEVARKAAKSSRDNLAAEQARRGIYRGLPVTYVVTNGKAIFQGDIILDKVDPIDPRQPQSSFGINSVGITYSQYLWPKVGNQYQIPYIIGAGSGNVTNLNAAISQFNSTFANIKFVARTTQTDYVNFYFDPNNNNGQCEATLGRAGGEQQVGGAGGSFNPCAVGTLLHEMGHTIGLWHEQARSDRDTYLLVEVLTFAVEALSGLPIELRPDNNIADMKRLVEEFVRHDAGLAHSQMIARRRLGYVLAYGKTNGT